MLIAFNKSKVEIFNERSSYTAFKIVGRFINLPFTFTDEQNAVLFYALIYLWFEAFLNNMKWATKD